MFSYKLKDSFGTKIPNQKMFGKRKTGARKSGRDYRLRC